MARAARGLIVVLLAAALLSGCGGSSPRHQVIDGQPSLDISVPLSLAACAPDGDCYALGTTGLDSAPDVAAQVSAKGSSWAQISAPSAPSTVLDSWACWVGGCLFGGSDPSGDVVWAASGRTLVSVSAPAGGEGVLALSCFGSGNCAVLDVDSAGVDRLSVTDDHGSTWSNPLEVAWPDGTTPDALACTSADHCVVVGHLGATGSSSAEWAVTTDGGATWSTGSNSGWSDLSGLGCFGTRCEALASGSSGEIVNSNSGGATWRVAIRQPHRAPLALSCVGWGRCGAVATAPGGGLWVAVERAGRWSQPTLQYAPGPAVTVGCGGERCVAVGTTTTVVVPL